MQNGGFSVCEGLFLACLSLFTPRLSVLCVGGCALHLYRGDSAGKWEVGFSNARRIYQWWPWCEKALNQKNYLCWRKKRHSPVSNGLGTGADPGFWSGGPVEFWPQLGLSPKFAQNRGFSLKLPENCMILILGAMWGGGVGPPRSASEESNRLVVDFSGAPRGEGTW